MPNVTEKHATLQKAEALKPKLVELRRRIHQNPELSFEEKETGKLVAKTMQELGYDVRPGVGGTGVIASMGSGRTIMIRADMDALPIVETNKEEYCSKNEGVMHACGHDAHTACGLGAAMLIAEEMKSGKREGCVRFMFQPAEEKVNADGKSGATLMIEQGVSHGAEGVLGLHVFPELPVGFIAVREGPFLAACDSFDLTIRGATSHGAYPQDGIDAIVLASHAIQSIQTIISRRKSALDPAVITLGGIKSTTYQHNIVAGEVQLTGTARYFEPSMHVLLKEELRRACSVVEALGGSFELKYTQDNPPLVNDGQLANLVRKSARTLLGQNAVVEPTLQMGADDFSFLSAHMPSCYFILGALIQGNARQLHTPTFDINEDALPIGAAMLAHSALTFLGS